MPEPAPPSPKRCLGMPRQSPFAQWSRRHGLLGRLDDAQQEVRRLKAHVALLETELGYFVNVAKAVKYAGERLQAGLPALQACSSCGWAKHVPEASRPSAPPDRPARKRARKATP
jgi:hypothetical protein